MNRSYKHIFFDLDRTLWDFDTNSAEALSELFDSHRLSDYGIDSAERFVSIYREVNEEMWEAYRNGKLQKRELRRKRFTKALEIFGCFDEELGAALDANYVAISPHKTAVLPGCHEILGYLREKYTLHIITNGFEEVQHIKLEKSGLKDFFKTVMTSERARARKPDPIVFHLALQEAGARQIEAIMIGDDLHTDVKGAKEVWIDQVYFNPSGEVHEEKVTHEIRSLEELRLIL